MAPTSNQRVDLLEQRMDALSTLPDRVASLEGQFLQFRDETRGEFAAMRAEMRHGFDDLRAEMRNGDEETRHLLRSEMRALHADTLQRIDQLRAEMQAGDEETRRHARVLHEEVLARFALLDERWNGGRIKPSSRKKPQSGPRRG